MIKICPYCNENYSNKRKHYSICPNRRHTGWSPTQEERLRISNTLKKYKQEHPELHNWKNKNKFNSNACNKVKQFLKVHNIDYIEEYNDVRWNHLYRLDIAILNKQIGIEVNGNQHYNKNGSLNDYYLNRHNYLESLGWTIIELPYDNCIDLKLNDLLIYINTKKLIDINIYNELVNNNRTNIKKQKEKEKIEKLINQIIKYDLKLSEKARKQLIKDIKAKKAVKIKRISPNRLSSDNFLLRKNLILNSNVDLTKFGWVNKVEKITGLTRRQINKVVNNTDLKNQVYYRKLNN